VSFSVEYAHAVRTPHVRNMYLKIKLKNDHSVQHAIEIKAWLFPQMFVIAENDCMLVALMNLSIVFV